MDRRGFITWMTAAGASLTLPRELRPTIKWEAAQEFWVSTSYEWTRSVEQPIYLREMKEMFVPMSGRLAAPPYTQLSQDRPPNFSYGTPWRRVWKRGLEPNFSLGGKLPEATLLSRLELSNAE